MLYATSVIIALATYTGFTWASPYSKACNQGPEYWCVNYRNADECGAVGHCLQTVWSKQKYAVDQDMVAHKVTKLFEQLKQRHGNYNDEELQSVLDSTCRSVPHVSAGLRCKNLLSERASELKVLLSSELSPGALCSVMSLCNDKKMDQLLTTPKHKKSEKHQAHKMKRLGGEKCTWGPSYWCANISNSHDCGATRHCVERVWSKTAVKADNDSVCQICLDMVKQARDQLMSNETQEELKEVFDGSCDLIPIKIIAKECKALMDQFVPELVETLSSEMNPSQVCSVAGLCNNARIDKLLQVYEKRKSEDDKSKKDCSGCHRVVNIARNNFDNTNYEDFLTNMLKMCRNAGSFSDSCSMLAFSHYEDIVSSLREHFTADNVCHMSGQCSHNYHSHGDEYVELSNAGTTGVVVNNKDDLPCELCEQLVKHLRDVVITNTTESEFFTVLKGICKQTGNFKGECLSLVEQWYPVIYNYLQSDLDPQQVCGLIGVCPSSNSDQSVLIAPLVTSEVAVKAITPSSKLIGNDEANSYKRVKIPSKTSNVRVMGEQTPAYALPIERMFPVLPQNNYQSDKACVLCQYILHYVQVEISDSKNVDKIKNAIEHACDMMPKYMSDQCDQFVEAYGPAIIALLVQEIDPSSVCPALTICPKTEDVKKVEMGAGTSCPLCLFTVEQLETVLQNNKTEERIRSALENLCHSLSPNLKPQCVDFVDKYSEKLVEMIIADLNAQEICVYLKICKDKTPDPLNLRHTQIDKYHDKPYLRGDANHMRKRPRINDGQAMIETNEIPDSTYNGKPIEEVGKGSNCVICEFVLKEIDSQIKNRKNEDEVKKIVHSICNIMPKSVSKECNMFVDKYADVVIALLAQELDPDEVCRELKLCPDTDRKAFKENVLDCAVCESVVWAVEKVLGNSQADHRAIKVMEQACGMLPAKYNDRCKTLMEVYGDSIIRMIVQYGAKDTCRKLTLCGDIEGAYLNLQKP